MLPGDLVATSMESRQIPVSATPSAPVEPGFAKLLRGEDNSTLSTGERGDGLAANGLFESYRGDDASGPGEDDDQVVVDPYVGPIPLQMALPFEDAPVEVEATLEAATSPVEQEAMQRAGSHPVLQGGKVLPEAPSFFAALPELLSQVITGEDSPNEDIPASATFSADLSASAALGIPELQGLQATLTRTPSPLDAAWDQHNLHREAAGMPALVDSSLDGTPVGADAKPFMDRLTLKLDSPKVEARQPGPPARAELSAAFALLQTTLERGEDPEVLEQPGPVQVRADVSAFNRDQAFMPGEKALDAGLPPADLLRLSLGRTEAQDAAVEALQDAGTLLHGSKHGLDVLDRLKLPQAQPLDLVDESSAMDQSKDTFFALGDKVNQHLSAAKDSSPSEDAPLSGANEDVPEAKEGEIPALAQAHGGKSFDGVGLDQLGQSTGSLDGAPTLAAGKLERAERMELIQGLNDRLTSLGIGRKAVLSFNGKHLQGLSIEVAVNKGVVDLKVVSPSQPLRQILEEDMETLVQGLAVQNLRLNEVHMVPAVAAEASEFASTSEQGTGFAWNHEHSPNESFAETSSEARSTPRESGAGIGQESNEEASGELGRIRVRV